MKRLLLLPVLFFLVCPTFADAQNRDRDRRDRDRDERRSTDGDWRDLNEPGKRWTLLTKQQVDFRHDRDRVNIGDIGRHGGKFKQLQVRVDDAPVEIRQMTVTFEDGEKFDAINRRHRFDEGSRTLVIDLPGERARDIKNIDINYFSVENQRKDGKGTLMVYAR